MPRVTDQNKIKKLLIRCPELSNREAAHLCDCSEGTVRKVRAEIVGNGQFALSQNSIDEIKDILTNALSLRANAGGKIKTEIKRVLAML